MVVFRSQILASVLQHLGKLSFAAGTLLVGLSVVVGLVGQFRFALVGFVIGAGLLTHYAFRHRGRRQIRWDLDPRFTTIPFLVLFSFMTAHTFQIRQSPFRDPMFFAGLALLSLFAVIDIYTFGHKRWGVWVILSKLTAISVLFRASVYTNIVYTNGDVYAHIFRAYAISVAGSLSEMPGYSDMPLFHLVWAELAVLGGTAVPDILSLMAAIPALGTLLYYVTGRALNLSRQTSLLAAFLFVTFTITNRTKVQTEAFVVAFFAPLVIYIILSGIDSTRTRVLFFVSLIGMFAIHFYYATLTVIWVGTLLLSASLLTGKSGKPLRRHISILFIVSSVLILLRMLTSGRLAWPVSYVLRFLSLAEFSEDVSPSFLFPEVSRLQFVTLHLTEFVVVGLSIIGLLVIFDRRDDFRVWMISTSFILLAGLTGIGFVFVSGNGSIGQIFRNVYFLSPFMLVFAALGAGYVLESVSRPRLVPILLCCLLLSAAVFGFGSQQSNKIGPSFYSGDVPSPKLATPELISMHQSFTSVAPEGSTVAGDTSTVTPLQPLTPNGVDSYELLDSSDAYVASADRVTAVGYQTPSLAEANGYSYLVTDNHTLERGMTFSGTTRGLQYDEQQLQEYIIRDNRIADSGTVTIYKNDAPLV